jgi:hypothetical protein
MHNSEPTLADLLDDPLVRAVMAADRVDPAVLAAELRGLAQRLPPRLPTRRAQPCVQSGDAPW